MPGVATSAASAIVKTKSRRMFTLLLAGENA
jgi:hypothetical protein